ncbi:S1 family peptidase [Hydrogenophaga palleronii]|uniref:S1 family peptidase n=1 Tax=Hydrogenophaga palleronii TaxID=65655 RepID=UPI0009FBC626|nr:serine protease [Hydrogenophaga palleronii]
MTRPPFVPEDPQTAVPAAHIDAPVDPLFLSTPRVSTFHGLQPLTNASGFFFEREGRLYLVTSRHVVIDDVSQHFPDRLEIELHIDGTNLTRSTGFSIPLYDDGQAVWRQGLDSGGDIDVAVVEIDRSALPEATVIRAFTPDHLQTAFNEVVPGQSLLVVGFPLGFHDGLHHLPVLRQAVVASPYGIRFQGHGYFLTDARTHRGTSGAAVVMRDLGAPTDGSAILPWKLLGVHSARMDMGNRDLVLDESLGLNCAWYADILLTLTEAREAVAEQEVVAAPPAPDVVTVSDQADAAAPVNTRTAKGKGSPS